MPKLWRRSPHELDPLSWFTGPVVAIILGGMAVTFAASSAVLVSARGDLEWLEWLAVAVLASAAFLISAFTRPGSPPLRGVRALAPIVLGWLAMLLAGIGYAGQNLTIEQWWAPIGLALLLVALAPYATAQRITILGLSSVVVTAAITVTVLGPSHAFWPELSILLIAVSSVALGTAASATFSYQVVARISRWASEASGPTLTSGVLGEAAKLRIVQRELRSVGTRTIPLLQRVADSGHITDQDRAEAAELAERLRSELVERANQSWLDTLALALNLTVVDPEHVADRMSPQQRTALLGLLRAGREPARGPHPTQVIELRQEPDGSTAVALSLDVRRAEGRRIKFLAPHYLNLSPAVDDLQLDATKEFLVRFRLPPPTQR